MTAVNGRSSTVSDLHYEVAMHTRGLTIGPMAPQSFLDKFLPTTRPSCTKPFTSVINSIPTRRRFKPFIKTIVDWNLCPGYDFFPLSTETTSKPRSYPDVAVYSTQVKPEGHYDWSLMEFFIQWRPDQDTDGYHNESRTSLEIRGGMLNLAAQLMDHQPRLFVFAVDIYGNHACLYRFDPSCVVVSEPIEFRQDPQPLQDFFKRYSALTLIQRGYDPTVTPANDAEKALFHARVQDYLNRVRRYNLRKHPDVDTLSGRIQKIHVNDTSGNTRTYMACKCSSIPVNSLPCGRITRGYVVTPLDPAPPSDAKGNLLWLKDCWRPASGDSEIETYRELKVRGVPNLPDIKCAGDVSFNSQVQESTNHSLLCDGTAGSWSWSTTKIKRMIHHRIVSGILIPLECVENAGDLLRVGRDILHAIASAFHKADTFHRDVSKGNVMMTENQSDVREPWGVLNDWDQARGVDAEPHGRTGTWQFISASLLGPDPKPHDIFDDLESLLWVLLFVAIHRFKYIGFFDMRVFDEVDDYIHKDGSRTLIGGNIKLWWLHATRITFECKPLQAFFESFRRFHRDHETKVCLALDDDGNKPALKEYEAEIEKDVYALLSHFDNILDNADTDWTGQEAIGVSSTTQEYSTNAETHSSGDDASGSKSPIETSNTVRRPNAKKRKRDDHATEGRKRKRVVAREPRVRRSSVVSSEACRRKAAPPPCDRVLRSRLRR